MLGEETAVLLREIQEVDETGAILDSNDAPDWSPDGKTEMVNPQDSGDESDCEQEESSGRSEHQGANAAHEGGSGGEPELVERNEGDETSMLEQLRTEGESSAEQGKGLRLEVGVAACAKKAHAQSGTAALEQTNSVAKDEIACVHANDAPCQELSVADEPQHGGSEENKEKDLETNEQPRMEKADVTANDDLEVADEAKEGGPVPPPEFEGVSIPLHWHPKPCVQIAGLGGTVSQEELTSLISKYAPVASIVFENDKRDAVIVRLQVSPTEEEEVVSAIREALNNMHFKDKTLVVEPFRPDSLLFIGNLTPEIDDELLKQMFEPHGRIERAFILRNEEGRSKGYGFVEYSLKSQASTAKQIMGNINMDGRVLRVEWSDCRKVADMFSTVLFVDRIAKECPNIESILKSLFGEYGKVRDCHLAIGMSQQFRGFAFVDFNHSTYADKAHEALDGKEVQASNIRVSFANPSKSAQSYKSRFGNQGTLSGLPSRGFPGVVPAMMGVALRSWMAMPFLAPRFIGPRPGMLGMRIGMQFGSGIGPGMIGCSLAGPVLGAGGGMLGPRGIAEMMGRAPGLLLWPVPISPAAIAQVATAQAKAREEEAKARAEFRRLEQAAQQAQIIKQPGQNLYQQQQAQLGISPERNYSYLEVYQPMKQQPYTAQPTPQQQQESTRLSYTSSCYPQSGQQQYIQQPSQPQLQAAYYQQQQPLSNGQVPSTGHQQYIQYSQQYNQQQEQQQTQEYTLLQHDQAYDQTKTQTSTQQYTQYQQPTMQRQYTQQEYDEYYSEQQKHAPAADPTVSIASTVNTRAQEIGHQQVYAAYYQRQAQLTAAQAISPVNQIATTAAGQQETLEAQWAAYYAAQQAADQDGREQPGAHGEQAYNGTAATTAYYQQPEIVDVGQKRSADHLDYYASQQQQSAYSYHQHPGTSMLTYQQQTTTATDVIYQQQNGSNVTSYQQAAAPVGYQHQNTSVVYTASLQQPTTSALPTSQQPSSSYYLQSLRAYQQPSLATPPLATLPEFNKRPRY